MNKDLRFFWRLVLKIEIPFIAIFTVLTIIGLLFFDTPEMQDKLILVIKNNLFAVITMIFIVFSVIIMATLKGTSKKLSLIVDTVNRLVKGDTELALNKK